MTTVLYLGSGDGSEVVTGLSQAAPEFTVRRSDPAAVTELSGVDCLLTPAETLVDGEPAVSVARANGYHGPAVLLGSESHETLAERCEDVGAAAYVRQDQAADADGADDETDDGSEGGDEDGSESEVWRQVAETVKRTVALSRARTDGSTSIDATDATDATDERADEGESVAEVAELRTTRDRRLRRERDQFASLFENTSDAVVDVEYVDDEPIIRDVNAQFEETFGVDRGSVIGTNLDSLIVPEGESESSEVYRGYALAGEPHEQEVRRTAANGIRDFLLRSVPFDDGESVRGYAIYTDITERKQTERTLGRLHETMRELVQAEDEEDIATITVQAATDILGYPVTTVRLHDSATESLRLVAVSEYTEAVLGERPSEGPEVGLAWEAFEKSTPIVVDDFAAYDLDDVGIEAAMYLPLGDRGLLTLGTPEADRFDESERRLAQILAANVGVALERTDRVRVLREREDELARQNERLESFASVVSHDLRNPLSVARGYLELARETALDEDSDPTPHFERVERAHERMNRLITDLLALARQGQSVGVTSEVDLEMAARQAWETVDTDGSTLELVENRTIYADDERLKTMFENLFRNSVEHGSTPEDPVHIRVGLVEDGFYVEDDGPGVPPEKRDDVFERGYSTSESGTGFGLSIVRGIVEAHGWTIHLEESASGGARFEVCGVDTTRLATASTQSESSE